MEDLDVDNVVIQRFDRQLAGTSARDFVMKLKKHLGFQQLLVGQGFALGHGREGDVPTLQRLGAEFGFGVSVHPPVLLDGLAISSSQIRSALAAGNVERASQLLGRPYRVAGEVVQGDARGQMIGIPTANLQTWPEQLMPAVGVYACLARIGETVYQAATNIGMRPTFEGLDTVQYLEAHLLDFHGNLYGQKMQLDFLARLRDEEKFDTVQALVEKIQQDIAQTREILTRAQS